MNKSHGQNILQPELLPTVKKKTTVSALLQEI